MRGEQLNQETLDWNPYAELPGMEETQEAPAGELSARPEEVEIKSRELSREQQQGLGAVAIAGMLESGRMEESETVDVGANDTIAGTFDVGTMDGAAGGKVVATENESSLEMDFADTVINRAEQALGAERFAGLVGEMMSSADTDETRETMRKFRESAGAALMDAGELWQAVLAQSKRERYPEIERYREEGKFYYAMSLEELEKALAVGKLERTDKSGNSLKSDLVLSGDRLMDGEWQPGFEEGRDVTLVLDGALVDRDDFVAIRRRPTVDEIDLKKYCLGFVSDYRNDTGRTVRRMVRKSALSGIPVYQQYDNDELVWVTRNYPAEALREQVADYGRQMRNYETVRAEIYDDVDREGISAQIEEMSGKFDRERLAEIILNNQRLESDKEKERAELELMRYYGGVLGIETLPTLVRVDDSTVTWRGRYSHGRNLAERQLKLNGAKLDEGDLAAVVSTVGHEMRHAYQRTMIDKMRENPEEIEESERRRVELFQMNFDEYVRSMDDPYQYANQLVEVDAQIFAMACKKVYEEVTAELNKPMNRMKRGAEKVRKSAEGLMYKGKRVAKKNG